MTLQSKRYKYSYTLSIDKWVRKTCVGALYDNGAAKKIVSRIKDILKEESKNYQDITATLSTRIAKNDVLVEKDIFEPLVKKDPTLSYQSNGIKISYKNGNFVKYEDSKN